jgi:DNA-binding NarL/FixJ family response regulator
MRILVADDLARLRYALKILLHHESGFRVVAEAADVEELLTLTRAFAPDLLLLQWRLDRGSGADLMPRLRRICPGMRIVALSAQPEARRLALAAGADAFVCKADPPERLLEAIRSAGVTDSDPNKDYSPKDGDEHLPAHRLAAQQALHKGG